MNHLQSGKTTKQRNTIGGQGMTMRRSVLILNPTSGSSPLAASQGSPENSEEHILRALGEHGIEPEVLYTSEADPGSELARQATATGAELVIAAGGDGTLHAVAKGLATTRATLGIIPMGTMNNVARSLAIPEDIDAACAIIANGVTSLIDMGTINEQVFLEVAGIGLEAALFPAAEEIKRTGFWSTLHGIIQGFGTLLSFRPTRFVASFNGRRARRFRAVQISICNSPYYGARLQFAPRAVMDDGLLDVLIYRNFSKLEYIRHAISISRGQRALAPRVIQRRIKSMRLRAAEPVPVHADGEAMGTTPVFVNIQSGVLHVRVPQKVVAGPNVVRRENREAGQQLVAPASTQKERRGPLHVS
jgi:diacylglycerol kinase (ATP)